MPQTASGKFALSKVARVGIFAALAYGVNAPFLAIPNVETFSLALFLSGVFLGVADGLAVAFIAGIIFVLFNPNGPQTILLVGAAQMVGFLLFGLAGGVIRPLILIKSDARRIAGLIVIVGASLTLWYDVSTNLILAIIIGPLWPTLIGGLGFGIIHFISNAVIFGMSSLIINRIWKRIQHIMPPLAGL
jgi:hypothetical protein